MSKILFVGHATCKNRGCEAILRCSTNIISQYLPDVSFDIVANSETIQYDFNIARNWEVTPNFLPRPFHRTKHLILPALKSRLGLSRGYPKDLYWQRNMHGYYFTADMVLAVGGDNFTESYGIETAVNCLRDVWYAQHIRKPTVIWAASIGPFNHEGLRDLAINIFKRATLITVRERWSEQYLKSLGISENVRLVSDPAFLLGRKRTERTTWESIFISKVTLGVGVSALKSKFLGVSRATYEEIMAQFIDYVTHSCDATILLIPHVMYQGNDDLLACNAVMRKIKRKNRVILAGNYNMQADELKEAIAQCNYFIGCRTHSTIAALSSFVPTIAIAYSKKALGIFEQVYGHADYIVDGSSITLDKLIEAFEEVRSHREKIVELLKKRVPELKHQALKGGAYLASIFKKN